MRTHFAITIGLVVVVCTLTLGAQQGPATEAQLREGDDLMSRLRYEDALVAYRGARANDDARVRIRAGAGAVQALLRLNLYGDAEREGAAVALRDPSVAAALSVHGDTLWASGLFPEAEARYAEALTLGPNDPAGRHGLARALAARGQIDAALTEVTAAIAAAPREPGFHYTLAAIYEQRHQFKEAADTLARYLLLLPARDESDLAKWAKTQEEFLRRFGRRTPMKMVSAAATYTVPFRMLNGRIIVRGRVNGRTPVNFALDTGTDQTILTPAVARHAGVVPAATLQTAGVGSLGLGFRGLEIARMDELAIGDLTIQNVPCLIKSPTLLGLPRAEGAAFSPLALGLSVIIDHGRGLLTIAKRLPAGEYTTRLPMRMLRLPMVQGLVNGASVGFAVDTAGEATAIGRRVALDLGRDAGTRLVPVNVYGSAGLDPSAFLLPFVTIELAPGVGLSNRSIIVLNLDAPSALLGFKLGGIIGQEFLQRHVVALDLVRGELGLRPMK